LASMQNKINAKKKSNIVLQVLKLILNYIWKVCQFCLFWVVYL